MESIMKLPMGCALVESEEMTYLDGGATTLQAVCAWVVPFYGWYKGVTAVRDWRKSHGEDWIDSGLDYFSNHMDKTTQNLFYDVGCAISVVGSVTSIIMLPVDWYIIYRT